MPSVSIVIPAMRANRITDVIASIVATTTDYEIIVVATGDCAAVATELPVTLINDGGGSWPKRLNLGYKSTHANFIFTGADDLKFHPNWFESAMITMNQFPNGFGVVAVNDYLNRAGVHFLIAKRYIDEIGGVLDQPVGTIACEAYAHSYCDDELRTTALFHNRFAYCNDSVVEHMHTGAGKAENDAIYEMGNATMASGLVTYQSRSYLWQQPA